MQSFQKQALAAHLNRLTKQTLARLVCELAGSIPDVWRNLEQRFDIRPESTKEIIREAELAIAAATDFDERDSNRNFDVDWNAYERLQRWFKALAKAGEVEALMKLGAQLMKDGSYQVEMSDEGMMSGEITKCLAVVFAALKKSDVPLPRQMLWVWGIEQRDGLGIAPELVADFWRRPIPSQAWSEFADSLVREVKGTKEEDVDRRDWSDGPDWKRQRLLDKARKALKKAGRDVEVATVAFPEPRRGSARRVRRARR